MPSIEQLRERIERRLHEVQDEAEQLQAALNALGSPAQVLARAPRERSRKALASSRPPRRAPRGSVRQAVLEALGDGQARTPGEIAQITGLSRTSIASTLSRLYSEGTLRKPARGYVLARGDKAVCGTQPEDRAIQELRGALRHGLRTIVRQ
jgi:DNA-binding transcriptional ArsR family regulator